MSPFLVEVLSARQALKSLLESGAEETLDFWFYETEKYKFCRLSSGIVPLPSYGYGVYLKSSGLYAYWYRDLAQSHSPLLVFSCSPRFDNPSLLI